MVTQIREIEVAIYVDTNKATHEATYKPNEDESLSDLLRRLADEYEKRSFP